MSTEPRQITVSGVPVSVVRKAIRNLHLGVYPPDGRVRVAAPLRLSDDAVRLAVIGKLGWIKKQQARFASQPRQAEREMVSGESHYLLGRRYLLHVVVEDKAPSVMCRQSTIELTVRPGTSTAQRERVLQEWYRWQLKDLIPPLVSKWQDVLHVRVADWSVRKMKTRWGSCNTKARRIWLNLELAKLPVHCLEYVVVHELVHLIERRHNERFRSILDHHMPQWRAYRREMNKAPLVHDTWTF